MRPRINRDGLSIIFRPSRRFRRELRSRAEVQRVKLTTQDTEYSMGACDRSSNTFPRYAALLYCYKNEAIN